MSNYRSWYNSKENENPLEEAALGRPSAQGHWVDIPQAGDSLWRKMWAARDMFYQHHWDALEVAKYALVGGLISGTYGTGIYVTHLYDPSTYTFRKAQEWASTKRWGGFRLFMKFNQKFVLGGAFAAAAWCVWWNIICTHYGEKNNFSTYILGYSLYGAAAAAAFHPRLAYKGALFASCIGLLNYFNRNAQLNIDKTQVGFSYEIPNTLTEEERKIQGYKDELQFIGRSNVILNRNMETL